MSNILIIGNTAAAVSAIEGIRSIDKTSVVTLFCPEGNLPYQQSLLSALIAKDIKEQALFLKPEKFFTDHNVKLVCNETLVRISTKRRQITTESKNHFAFDKLLLIDMPELAYPSIKGIHRKGVYNAYQLNGAKELVKNLPYADNIVVSVTTWAGFDMACALLRSGKEVMMVCSMPGVLNEVFDEETALLLKQIVEARGIRVVTDEIEEVLGDTDVKAVRLKTSKIMAAQIVVFDQVAPDLKMLADSDLLDHGKILADEYFNSSIPEVFACGSVVSGLDLTGSELGSQGKCSGVNMLNPNSMSYKPPLVIRDFGFKVCDGFCGGNIRLQDGGREHMKFDGPTNIFKKIYLLNDHLEGAVWFNCLTDKPRIEQALIEKRSLAGSEDAFL